MSSKPPAWSAQRLHEHPSGRRLNLAAAAAVLDLKPDTFSRRQRRGWAALNGGKLAALSLPIGSADGGYKEATFLEADVLALRDAPPRTDGVHETADGERLGREAAMRELGVHYNTLQRLEVAGQLTAEERKHPTNGHAVKTYAREQVLALKARREAKPKQREGPGGWYVPRRKAMKRLNVSNETLRRWRECCPHLDGHRGIRWLRVPTSAGGPETWYHEDDVRQVEAALGRRKVGQYPLTDGLYLTAGAVRERYPQRFDAGTLRRLAAAGRVRTHPHPAQLRNGRDRLVYNDDDLAAALEARKLRFDGIYQTEDGRRYNLRRAAVESGFSVNFLKKQVKASAYLAEGKLPSLPMSRPLPPSRGRQECTVRPEDLDRLRDAINGQLAASGVPADWGTADDFARCEGITKLEDRILLCVLLAEWRGDGRLNARRIVREWPRQGQAERHRAWIYDLAQAARLLNGEPKNKGGRPISETTLAFNKACWELFIRDGTKMALAVRELRRRFPERDLEHGRNLRCYAQRHVNFVLRNEGVRLSMQRPSLA